MHLLKNVRAAQVLGYFAAGTTKRTSTIVDAANYEGVMFIAHLGTIINAGTIDVYVEQNTVNSVTGMARLATTTVFTVTAVEAAYTESQIIVDVYKPVERYLQCNITPATQNAVILGITALMYGGRKYPSTYPVSVLKNTVLVSPAEV